MTHQDEQLPDLSFVPADDPQDKAALQELIGELVTLREAAGLSQPDLAKRLDSRRHRVVSWESGEHGQFLVSLLQRYARAVGARLTFNLVNAEGEVLATVDGSP